MEKYDFKKRAEEKQKSRDQDEEDLRTGKITREELRKRNGAFAFPNAKIMFDEAKKLY